MDLSSKFKDVAEKQQAFSLASENLKETLLETFAPLFSGRSPIHLNDSANPEWLRSAMIEEGRFSDTNIFVLAGIREVVFFPAVPCMTKWKAKAIPISAKTAKKLESVVIKGTFVLKRESENVHEANQRFFNFVEQLLSKENTKEER